jgi:transmembrane sensor
MLTALRPFRAERTNLARRVHGISWKIAAALIVCGALGAGSAFYFQPSQPRYTTYITAIGGHKTLALADGTRIELNTDTVVRLLDDDNRKIWLDRGEAFFEVHHDAMHPFEVTVGDHKVTDIGTKFLIKHHSDDTEVALVEGSARFDDTKPGEARSLTLTQGDVVVANAEAVSVSRKKPAVLTSELGWRHGVLIFEQISLFAVASELNRYNQKKLVIADAAAGGVKIGGTFRTDDVQAIANAAREVFGLQVEDRGSEIVISR